MFDELYFWLIIGSNLNDSIGMIDDFSFGLSTDFCIAIEDNENYILYDVYNPGKMIGGKLNVSMIGNWNITSGFNFYVNFDKVSRWNLNGLSLKAMGLVILSIFIFSF